MWQLLSRRWQILIIVFLTIIVWTGIETFLVYIQGSELHPIRYISVIGGIILGVLGTIANMVWRKIWKHFPWLEQLAFPDLNGVWIGTLKSSWVNPETNERVLPIHIKIHIRQTLFTMSVSLKTEESSSFSTRCFFDADYAGQIFRIWYSYENFPKAEVAPRSARHEGICWLEINLAEGRDHLTGQYYTYRNTRGDIELIRGS